MALTRAELIAADVVIPGDSSADAFVPVGSDVPTNGLYLPAANSVAISTNGTGALFIDSTGKVGLNVADPAARMEIVDQNLGSGYQTLVSADAPTLAVVNAVANSYLRIAGGSYGNASSVNLDLSSNQSKNKDIQGGWRLKSITGSPASSATGSNFQIVPTTYTSSNTITEGSAAITIDQSNRVGIGSTTARGRLDVQSGSDTSTPVYFGQPLDFGQNQTDTTIHLTGNHGDGSGPSITFSEQNATVQGATGRGARIASRRWFRAGDFRMDLKLQYARGADGVSTDALYLGEDRTIFSNGGSERMRIDSSGRLLVGTSSDSGGALLQVNGRAESLYYRQRGFGLGLSTANELVITISMGDGFDVATMMFSASFASTSETTRRGFTVPVIIGYTQSPTVGSALISQNYTVGTSGFSVIRLTGSTWEFIVKHQGSYVYNSQYCRFTMQSTSPFYITSVTQRTKT